MSDIEFIMITTQDPNICNVYIFILFINFSNKYH